MYSTYSISLVDFKQRSNTFRFDVEATQRKICTDQNTYGFNIIFQKYKTFLELRTSYVTISSTTYRTIETQATKGTQA